MKPLEEFQESKRGTKIEPESKRGKKLLRLALFSGIAVFTASILLAVSGNAMLNRYGKHKLQRSFRRANPGCELRIGRLDYSLWANRLTAENIVLLITNSTLHATRVSLNGVHWVRLMLPSADLTNVLSQARLDAVQLGMRSAGTHYGISCVLVHASVPDSELTAESFELNPLLSDEEFFATNTFRSTRFHLAVTECRVLGINYQELLRGTSYRFRSIQVSRPSLDAFVNRDKPVQPRTRKPLMVHEALKAIRTPIEIGKLEIKNGSVRYAERLAIGSEPGVLTFSAVRLAAEEISNRVEPTATIEVKAQGDIMEASTLKVSLSIPINPADFALRYSGSLAPMELPELDRFLVNAEGTRIKSGKSSQVLFQIDVNEGHAQGYVHANYHDLEVALVDKQTGSENGLVNRVGSILTHLKVRSANPTATLGSRKKGEVNYVKKPDDEFVQFLWFALRTGVLDLISR